MTKLRLSNRHEGRSELKRASKDLEMMDCINERLQQVCKRRVPLPLVGNPGYCLSDLQVCMDTHL